MMMNSGNTPAISHIGKLLLLQIIRLYFYLFISSLTLSLQANLT
jgi:hypothetical protein